MHAWPRSRKRLLLAAVLAPAAAIVPVSVLMGRLFADPEAGGFGLIAGLWL